MDTPVTEDYLKTAPYDFEFASYLKTLERSGITKEHMEATGLLTQIEERKKMVQGNNSLSIAFEKCLPLNKTNLELLEQIKKLEHLGQKTEEIVAALKIPDAILAQLQLGLIVPDMTIEMQRKK